MRWIAAGSMAILWLGCTTSTTLVGPACEHTSTCPSSQVCIARQCVEPTACTSSRSCPGLVCDTTRGVCVECVLAPDCAAGEACVEGVCEVSDASTATDAGVDAYLDRDAGSDASPLDGGQDAGTDAGSDAGPAVWEPLSVGGGGLYGPGYSDQTPLAADGRFYSSSGREPYLARFDPSTGWTSLHMLAMDNALYYASPTRVADALYVISLGAVNRYDIATDAWATPATGVAAVYQSMNAHDDAGHVFAVTADDRVVTFDVASSAVSYQAFGMDVPATSPRLVWDPTTRLIYISPNIVLATMYSFDPLTGTVHSLASLPASRVTPTFCGDRAGHLYAAGDNTGSSLLRYDIASNAWSVLSPPLPFDHEANGSCTVAGGYLYYTDTGTNLARLRVH